MCYTCMSLKQGTVQLEMVIELDDCPLEGL